MALVSFDIGNKAEQNILIQSTSYKNGSTNYRKIIVISILYYFILYLLYRLLL